MNKIFAFIFIAYLDISSSFNTPKYIQKLAEKNYKLTPFFAKPYIKKYKLTYDQKQELYQEGYVGLMYACRKYNSSKGSISTYSSFWINRYLNNYIKKNILNKNYEMSINYDLIHYYDDPIFDTNLLRLLTINEKKVIYLRYVKKLKVKDIASLMDCSRNTITNICNSAKKKIKMGLDIK